MRWEEMQRVMEEIQNGERRRAYLAASYLAVAKGHRGGGGEMRLATAVAVGGFRVGF